MKLKLKDSPQASDALNINRKNFLPPKLILIPIDFKILKQRSIYSVKNVFDFGLIKLGEKSKQLVIDVYSTVEKSIDIEVNNVFLWQTLKFTYSVHLCRQRRFHTWGIL